MDKIIDLARELGYEGQELRDFISRQQDRESERLKFEAIQKDKDLEKLKFEAIHKDKDLEKFKIEAEREIAMKKLELELLSHSGGPKSTESNARFPKLPYFDEKTDQMDSYLTRFESYATACKWDPAMWALYLSALLKGRALEVFVRLSKDDQSDYEQIREALLNNFNLTERQFKRKFRECRPEKSETFRQFSSRMASYLEKWLAMAKVEKTFEAVCDFLARDQFLEIANQDMYVFLKTKSFKTLGDMARDADLFADASGGVSYCLASGQRDLKSSGQTHIESTSVERPKLSCNICGKAHSTHECWYNPDQKATSNVDVAIVKPQYKGDNSNSHSKSCKNYDGKIKGVLKGVQSNNVTEHQVNFCKIKNAQSGKHVARVKRVHFAEDITCSREYQTKLESPHSSKEESPHQDKEGACHFPRSRLPTAVGTVNGKEVRVLRDTGCTGVIVKRNLVSENQFMGKECGVTLINDSQQKFPVARINIDCPFFRGTTDALCIDDPAHDLVIGNIEGSKFPDMTHFSSGVFKNKQSRKDRRKNRMVKVADKFIRQNRQELCMKQASDAKLVDIRRRVESGSVTKGRSGETKFIRRNGLIYRHFKKNANVSLQLVVPSSLTHSVMNLAHESRKVVNHRGRKETISKVLDEFYWPGVCREVTQFCRSCAICQRTTHNIKVAMTHCCSVPQRNISSKEAVVSRTRRTDSQTERRRSYGSGRRCPIPYYWRNMTVTDSSSQH